MAAYVTIAVISQVQRGPVTMTRTILVFLLLAGCAAPLTGPYGTLSMPMGSEAEAARRGAVELVVKSQFDTLLAEIAAGGGPVLSDAMSAAAIPELDRPARTLQLQGDLNLFRAAPGTLVTTLLLYGQPAA